MWKCSPSDRLLLVVVGFTLILQVSAGTANGGDFQLFRAFWSPERSRLISRDLECSRPDFYVCEELPPEVDEFESTKLCNYRNVHYVEQVYRWVAGRGCLFYTPDFLYVNGTNTINLGSACLYGTNYAPCLELAKPDGTCGCFPFDPSFAEVVLAVQEALLPSAHGRWERCYEAAAHCCTEVMSDSDVIIGDGFCGATFDGWGCWEATPANTLARQVCPEFAYTNVGPSCHHFSTKNCTEASNWEIQTEYGTCSITPRLIRRNRFYIWVLAVSTIACAPAIFVFFFYKRLRVTRVSLHRNLLTAIVIRNLLVIITRNEIYLDELINASDTSMSAHEWPCKVLAVAERISINFVFVCMLVEGIYLHRLICAVFRKKLNVTMLYGIGTVIAILPVVGWATVMALLDDHSCWLVYTVPNIQWTLDAPRITILVANTILFLDILRVLLTKVRNSENANQLSTAKATLFLMPLFGVQFLLTAYRPNTASCGLEQGYYIFTYSMEALQGVLVAILYCYANNEVHKLVKLTYKKTETAIVSRVWQDPNYRRRSTTGVSNRRETYSTGLDNPAHSPAHSPATSPADSPARSPAHSPPHSPPPYTKEEIPFPNVHRFATVLDPIEEAAFSIDAYDNSEAGSDSGYSPPDNHDDNYSKTSTGRTDETVECQDWIKCVSSPSSSIYDNSLNEYEIRYLEGKTPRKSETKNRENFDHRDVAGQSTAKLNDKKYDDMSSHHSDEIDNISFSDFMIPEHAVGSIDAADLFEQMLKTAVARKESGLSVKEAVVLNSDALSPNRPDTEKIIFVDE